MNKKVVVFILATFILASFHTAEAQQPAKMPRIGYLSMGSPGEVFTEAFRQGLRERGYMEGRNIVVEYRFAEGRTDRLPDLAADLVRLKVKALVTSDNLAAYTAKTVTTTIPIVMAISSDPVGSGLIDSLARPGGNITGFSGPPPEVSGKQLELLKIAAPRVSRVTLLWNPDGPAPVFAFRAIEAAAQAFGVQLQSLEMRSADELEGAVKAATKWPTQALILFRDTLFSTQRKRIADLAIKRRFPAMYGDREFPEAGGLMSYGLDPSNNFRHTAVFIDKILKGTKPADLPVEQPMKFELVINLKTAKQIGLTIPPELLMRADKVIK